MRPYDDGVRTLVFSQVALAIIVAVGPTANTANRIAGIASIAVSLVISAGIAMLSRRRELLLGLLAVVAIGITYLAFRYADPVGIRSPLAQAGVGLMARLPAERILPRHLLGLAAGPPALFLAALVIHRGHPVWLRVLWLGGAAAGAGAIILSDSRDTWIAAAAGVAVLALSALVRRRGVLILVAVALAAAAAFAVVSTIGDDVSLRQREDLWRIGLRHVAASPLFGVGYGGLGAILQREAPGVGTNAHNLVVQTLADFGVLGFIVLTLLAVRSAGAAVRDATTSSAAFRGYAACLTFLGVAGMAESLIDATRAFPTGEVTIVVPLLFAVLAVPVVRASRSP